MAKGDVVGGGRDVEIVDWGPGLVLRRPRRPRSLAGEARVMRWVGEHGYPVPAVVEELPDGVVMERVDGPSMLDVLGPLTLRRQLSSLLDLHEQLEDVPAAPGSASRESDRMVHGDLHPGNVILGPDGPVVIDWSNAHAGPPGTDLATTWLLMAGVRLSGWRQLSAELGRRLGVRELLRQADARGMLAPARSRLRAVLESRQSDDNLTPLELSRMAAVADRHAR